MRFFFCRWMRNLVRRDSFHFSLHGFTIILVTPHTLATTKIESIIVGTQFHTKHVPLTYLNIFFFITALSNNEFHLETESRKLCIPFNLLAFDFCFFALEVFLFFFYLWFVSIAERICFPLKFTQTFFSIILIYAENEEAQKIIIIFFSYVDTTHNTNMKWMRKFINATARPLSTLKWFGWAFTFEHFSDWKCNARVNFPESK